MRCSVATYVIVLPPHSADGDERRFLCVQVWRLPLRNFRRNIATCSSTEQKTTAFGQNSRVGNIVNL